MLVFFLYWIIPALFVVTCIILLLIRKSKCKRASLYATLAFGLFLLLGGYSILQYRSSTAAIGFIFLPIIALLPGSIGFVLGRTHTEYLQRKKNNNSLAVQKNYLIIFSLLVIAPFIWQLSILLNTISENKSYDIESARQREAIKNNIKMLDKLLSENSGKEVDILKKKVSETEDRTELIPIAKNKHASSDILKKLSKSVYRGVVLSVVRNPNTAAKTLEWIYKSHTYPSYFYTSLSSNPNTPKRILRELYDKRHQNTGIAWQLARNPKLPEDVLNKLTSEPRKIVLQSILNRSHISCDQVNKVVNTIKKLKNTSIVRLMSKSKNRMKNCVHSKHLQDK